MSLEADADISYSQLMGIYQSILDGQKRKKRDLPLGGFEEGKQLEKTVLSWVKGRCWPGFVREVFDTSYVHNKKFDSRVELNGPTAAVSFHMNARPDFVFKKSDAVYNIVDVKLGPVYPQYIIQALIIRSIFLQKFRMDPSCYLLYEQATALQKLELQSDYLEACFNLFCLSCMAYQNFNLQSLSGWGSLFDQGGGVVDQNQWAQVFDGSEDFGGIAKKSFNELIKYI